MGVSRFSVSVPKGEGLIIGDILRKYATRSARSWQPIGYKVAATSANFGISGGSMSSYLGLLSGRLVSEGNCPPQGGKNVKQVNFTWNGSRYEGEGFALEELPPFAGNSLTVCLLYACGQRSAEANYEELRAVLGDGAEAYFAVPSGHSRVSTFKYNVQPVDDNLEELCITADEGIARLACQNAIQSLSELNI